MNAHSSWFANTPEERRESRVNAGLAFLDTKFGRDKANSINLERLNTATYQDCPLSQLTGVPYNAALEKVGFTSQEDGTPYGLFSNEAVGRRIDDFQRLIAIFRRKIQERRRAA